MIYLFWQDSVQIDLHDSRTYDLAWIGSSSSARLRTDLIRAISNFSMRP